MHVFAAFGPTSTETAIFYIAAVVCFVLAALPTATANRFPGGAFRLVALGLGLWLWPLMWVTTKAAF